MLHHRCVAGDVPGQHGNFQIHRLRTEGGEVRWAVAMESFSGGKSRFVGERHLHPLDLWQHSAARLRSQSKHAVDKVRAES